MSMEDAEQQGATPAPAPEARNETAPPEASSGASQQERQLTKEELEQTIQNSAPPPQPQPELQEQPLVRPQFSARSVAPNEFQIFHGETPLGKRLTPSESAIVLAWAKSIDDSEA